MALSAGLRLFRQEIGRIVFGESVQEKRLKEKGFLTPGKKITKGRKSDHNMPHL